MSKDTLYGGSGADDLRTPNEIVVGSPLVPEGSDTPVIGPDDVLDRLDGAMLFLSAGIMRIVPELGDAARDGDPLVSLNGIGADLLVEIGEDDELGARSPAAAMAAMARLDIDGVRAAIMQRITALTGPQVGASVVAPIGDGLDAALDAMIAAADARAPQDSVMMSTRMSAMVAIGPSGEPHFIGGEAQQISFDSGLKIGASIGDMVMMDGADEAGAGTDILAFDRDLDQEGGTRHIWSLPHTPRRPRQPGQPRSPFAHEGACIRNAKKAPRTLGGARGFQNLPKNR